MKTLISVLLLAFATPTFAGSASRLTIRTEAPVTALSYAPDGQTFASAEENGRVALMTTRSGKVTQSFRYKKPVSAVAFVPNGKLLAVGVGRQVRLLNPLSDMKTAKPVLVLETSLPACEIEFSADGRVLLASEGDYTQSPQYAVEIWDVQSGKRIRHHTAKETDTYAATLSPDGKTFAALTHRFGCSLFSVATGKEIRKLSDRFTADTPPFEVPFMSTLSWSPDGKWLAGTGCYFEGAGHLTLWEAASGAMKWSRTFHDNGDALAWSPDSSRIAAGTTYDTTYDDPRKLHRPTGTPIFGINDGLWQRSMQRVSGEVNAMAWSPDGTTLAIGNEKGVHVWGMTN